MMPSITTALFLTSLLFRFSSIHVHAATTCTDAWECCNSNVTDNRIGCWGFQGCCYSDSLVAIPISVECLGAWSCMNTNEISAQFFASCHGGMSCINVTRFEAQFGVSCAGEKTCVDNDIYVSSTLDESYVSCDGHKGCMNANIASAPAETIEGFGTLSMVNAVVDISGDGSRTSTGVHLTGYYAAYGTTFTCKSGHTCAIECDGSGCDNTELIEEDGSTVTIDCDSSNKNDLCTDGYDEDWLETLSLSNLLLDIDRLDSDFEFSSYENSLELCDPFLNGILNTDANDTMGNMAYNLTDNLYNNGTIVLYGDWSEAYLENIINTNENGSICCMGANSCQLSPDLRLTKGAFLRCDGFAACRTSIITLEETGDIYCTSHKACESSTITSSYDNTVVYCTGDATCESMQLSNALYLLCTGYQACLTASSISNINQNAYSLAEEALSGATLDNIGNNIYCLSKSACSESTISNVVNNIYANGYRSLYQSTISNIGSNLYITGKEALSQSTINNINNTIYINSESGLHSTVIQGFTSLEINGDNALSNTKIYTTNTSQTVTITINSDNNDNYEIYCYEQDTCIIDINGNDEIEFNWPVLTEEELEIETNSFIICCLGTCIASDTATHSHNRDAITDDLLYCPEKVRNPKKTELQKRLALATDIQRYFLIALAALFVVTVGCAVVHFKKMKAKAKAFDEPKFFSSIRVPQDVADFISDVFFAGSIYVAADVKKQRDDIKGYKWDIFLFWLCALFVLIPFSTQILISMFSIWQWRKSGKRDDISDAKNAYLKKYGVRIVGLTAIMGLYTTIDLCRSRLFYLEFTSLRLNKKELQRLQYCRWFNVVMLENIPQLTLQLMYVLTNEFTEIAAVSIFFSLISIVFAFLMHASEWRYNANIRNKYNYKAKLIGEFRIICDKLTVHHSNSIDTIASCIDTTVKQHMQDSLDRRQATTNTEVFDVFFNPVSEDPAFSDHPELTVYFRITIFTLNKHDNDYLIDIMRANLNFMMNIDDKDIYITFQKLLIRDLKFDMEYRKKGNTTDDVFDIKSVIIRMKQIKTRTKFMGISSLKSPKNRVGAAFSLFNNDPIDSGTNTPRTGTRRSKFLPGLGSLGPDEDSDFLEDVSMDNRTGASVDSVGSLPQLPKTSGDGVVRVASETTSPMHEDVPAGTPDGTDRPRNVVVPLSLESDGNKSSSSIHTETAEIEVNEENDSKDNTQDNKDTTEDNTGDTKTDENVEDNGKDENNEKQSAGRGDAAQMEFYLSREDNETEN